MSCPICNDTGWKSVEREENGELRRRSVRCDCQQQLRIEALIDAARIPKRYEHCEVSEFMVLPGPDEQSMERAKFIAQKFVEEYGLDRNNTGLLFVGPIGVGKTHLAVGIMKELIRSRGVQALFCDYRKLLKKIQDSYNPSVNTTEMQVLTPILQAEVLVLDELGAVKPTEWVWDTVSHILNTRYNDQLCTIITTNLRDAAPGGNERQTEKSKAQSTVREATLGDRITERMRSRLHEMCLKIELQGKDFREQYRRASFR
jgi:DNA replication protein DnaC